MKRCTSEFERYTCIYANWRGSAPEHHDELSMTDHTIDKKEPVIYCFSQYLRPSHTLFMNVNRSISCVCVWGGSENMVRSVNTVFGIWQTCKYTCYVCVCVKYVHMQQLYSLEILYDMFMVNQKLFKKLTSDTLVRIPPPPHRLQYGND